jgi:hypothetical protein
MIDYSFEYKGDSYRIPKGKIFECLYAIGEVVPVSDLGEVLLKNDFMKAAKLFCIAGEYAKQKFDPIEVTQHYLNVEGGAAEIFNAIGGLVAVLNPPESYHPPETEEAGK